MRNPALESCLCVSARGIPALGVLTEFALYFLLALFVGQRSGGRALVLHPKSW